MGMDKEIAEIFAKGFVRDLQEEKSDKNELREPKRLRTPQKRPQKRRKAIVGKTHTEAEKKAEKALSTTIRASDVKIIEGFNGITIVVNGEYPKGSVEEAVKSAIRKYATKEGESVRFYENINGNS